MLSLVLVLVQKVSFFGLLRRRRTCVFQYIDFSVRFRDLLPAIWRLWLREPGIVVLTALSGNLSGNGLARPSSLPESVLFECSVPLAATTSPAENKLGTRATFCNSLPGQKILVNIVFNYGVGKDVPGFVYSVDSGDCYFVTGDSLPVEALVYRSTGSRSYTAVAWLLAKNPTTGYPKAAVTDLTYRDDKRGGNCYPDYPDYMEYGFKEGEQHDFYKYGHYQVVVRRDTDTGGLEGAKQFHFDIQILEGGITLAGSCPNIHPTMEYRF